MFVSTVTDQSRKFVFGCVETYRYGFNGKENDNEVKGTGNSVDFGDRIHDPRLGRFITLDNRIKDFPWLSPYAYAVNSPIKFIDENGEGPKDRVKAAKQFIGKPYSQDKDKNQGTKLRTGFSTDALAYMDCSELVCRVLHSDGITDKVMLKLANQASIGEILNNEDLFESSSTAQVGDIAFWEGHVGIVSSVDKNGKFKLTHAAGKKYGVLENGYHITAKEYRDSKFYGFYRPKKETPDGKAIDVTKENSVASAVNGVLPDNNVENLKIATVYYNQATNYYKEAASLKAKANAETDEDFKAQFMKLSTEAYEKGNSYIKKAESVKNQKN